ncbi:MAG TPA: hypothetical protein VII35_01770 [Steroidobacteraceae bacterium]
MLRRMFGLSVLLVGLLLTGLPTFACAALFLRLKRSWYQLNPTLELRVGTGKDDEWRSLLTLLNLPLVRELAIDWAWPLLDALLRRAGMPIPPVPLVAERAAAHFKREHAT